MLKTMLLLVLIEWANWLNTSYHNIDCDGRRAICREQGWDVPTAEEADATFYNMAVFIDDIGGAPDLGHYITDSWGVHEIMTEMACFQHMLDFVGAW